MKEEELRRSKREAEEQRKREEEARMAQSLLPESEVNFFGVQVNVLEELTGPVLPLLQLTEEAEDARMTTEQLAELAEALSILSAKSSVLKERDELRKLMEENLSAEEV